jgi:hypothetical protein
LIFAAVLYSIIFIMPLAAVKEANQICAVSIQNDTVISEYRSAVLAKKNIYAPEGRNYCPLTAYINRPLTVVNVCTRRNYLRIKAFGNML